MKPPIFSQPPTGTMAQQYLHRARMFRHAAIRLADYSNGEQFLPKYALLTHAIELALKAFRLHSEATGKPPGIRPSNHDLRGYYDLAIQYGLQDDETIRANIGELNKFHIDHCTRYPETPFPQDQPVPDLSVIADATADHLIVTFTQSINPR
jgi:hypothetical protein